MAISGSAKTTDPAFKRDWAHAARYYLGNRRALLIIALVVIAAGAALNWGWLVAAGIAPVLITALPCLVMCGLGLCMHKMTGGSCASQPSQMDQSTPEQSSSVVTQTTSANSSLLARVSSCCGVSADAKSPTDERKDSQAKQGELPHA